MIDRILVKRLYIEKFRKIKNGNIDIGKRLTVISGYNGIGKSNILSLIASGSGKNVNKQLVDNNFQPSFYDFFYIDPKELKNEYNSFLYYGYEDESEKEGFVKRLSLKDDTKEERGIRIIPRLHNRNNPERSISSLVDPIKDKYNVFRDSRVPIPTIFLSLSRLYPVGETNIKSNKLYAHNSFNTKKANEKYAMWYNSIIPNSIDVNKSNVYDFKKEITEISSTYMDLQNTTIKTQSIGQDNIGNIVNALVNFYLLSLEDDYSGGILCIDEIDVSLHPNIQMNMFELLDKLSKELNLQILMTSHSLVIIDKILSLENKVGKDYYSLVYLRNYSLPHVTPYNNYNALKADLYRDYSGISSKVKIYFEDSFTRKIFNMLLNAYSNILSMINNEEARFFEIIQVNSSLTLEKRNFIYEKIKKIKKINSLIPQLDPVDIHLGCDNLIKLSEQEVFFESMLIVLDGDARLNPGKRPKVSEYIKGDIDIQTFNTKKVKPNVIFLPGFFAPESYLYLIINEFTTYQEKYKKFWRSMDTAETFQFSRDNVNDKVVYKNFNFDNDDIKKHSEYILNFVEKSRIINHFYLDHDNIIELLNFIEKLENSFNIVQQKIESNRFNI